jgi:pyridoxine 5-phosphate synthase
MEGGARIPRLGVNIDHSATLRQARYRDEARTCGSYVEPDPVLVAQLAERAGADGITVHLREDRRHIQERDVERLAECLATPLNLEMAASEGMLAWARHLRPTQVCLVPENRREVTTEGGLDLAGQRDRLGTILAELRALGSIPSLFLDPDAETLDLAAQLGAPVVELHTGALANAFPDPPRREAEWERLVRAAHHAHILGITVHAGHGVNYQNIARIAGLPHLVELNIGHSILSRALTTGIEEAVRTMRERIRQYAPPPGSLPS